MLTKTAIIFFTGVAAASASIPTFPSQWSANVGSQIGIFQGGIKKADGEYCCEQGSGSCKVQTEGDVGLTTENGDINASRTDGGGQSIVSMGGKDMLVVQNGTAWTCQEYCPSQFDFESMLLLDPSTKDNGPATVMNKTTESYSYFDTILGVVKMDEVDWYIDISDMKNPVPFYQVEKLTPFGMAEIGESAALFDGYKAGKVDPTLFAIEGVATCPLGDSCDQNSNNKFENLRRKAYTQGVSTSKYQVDKKAASASVSASASSQKWASDWVAQEDAVMLINQGGAQDGDDYCCTSTYSSQCQIQYQSQSGMKYFDYSHNRTRFEDVVNGVTVVDFNKHKEYQIQLNGTQEVCVSFCPIDPEEYLDAGKDYFLDDEATDLGSVTFNGKNAEHYQWKETIFKVITMQTSDFYADQSGDVVVPVAEVDTLTPFGSAPIGTQNQTWSKFQGVTPDASKFDIQGLDSCPQDPQCGQQSFQARRFAGKQYKTFLKYYNQEY